MISDANVATLEGWANNWNGMEGPAQITLALIADWRKRGEALERAREWVESTTTMDSYNGDDDGSGALVSIINAALTPQPPPPAT